MQPPQAPVTIGNKKKERKKEGGKEASRKEEKEKQGTFQHAPRVVMGGTVKLTAGGAETESKNTITVIHFYGFYKTETATIC